MNNTKRIIMTILIIYAICIPVANGTMIYLSKVPYTLRTLIFISVFSPVFAPIGTVGSIVKFQAYLGKIVIYDPTKAKEK